MIVNFLALIRIVRGASDWIGVSTSSTGNKIDDAAMFVALIVMHVSGEDNEAGACGDLPVPPTTRSIRIIDFEKIGSQNIDSRIVKGKILIINKLLLLRSLCSKTPTSMLSLVPAKSSNFVEESRSIEWGSFDSAGRFASRIDRLRSG